MAVKFSTEEEIKAEKSWPHKIIPYAGHIEPEKSGFIFIIKVTVQDILYEGPTS